MTPGWTHGYVCSWTEFGFASLSERHTGCKKTETTSVAVPPKNFSWKETRKSDARSKSLQRAGENAGQQVGGWKDEKEEFQSLRRRKAGWIFIDMGFCSPKTRNRSHCQIAIFS